MRRVVSAAFGFALAATSVASLRAADATPNYAAQCVPHSQACKLYIAQLIAIDNQDPSSASGSGAEQPLTITCTQGISGGLHDAAVLYDIDWATLVYNGMAVAKAKTQAHADVYGHTNQSNVSKCNLIKLYKLRAGDSSGA